MFRQQRFARIRSVLDQLNQNQQEVIRLKFEEGLSYSEISEITGHSVSHVGVLIHAGMKKLRDALNWTPEGSYGGQ